MIYLYGIDLNKNYFFKCGYLRLGIVKKIENTILNHRL